MTPTELAIDILERQHAKGMAKYGKDLREANLSRLELLEHAIEEMADMIHYVMQEHIQSHGLTYHYHEMAKALVGRPDDPLTAGILSICRYVLEERERLAQEAPVPVHASPTVRLSELREGKA